MFFYHWIDLYPENVGNQNSAYISDNVGKTMP